MTSSFKIGNHQVGPAHEPFVIAEMSGNHNHSLERAKALIAAAAQAGAHAVKLQTYTADTITLDVDSEMFRIDDESSLWNGRRLHELYDEAHTPWEWHPALFECAAEHGILCFSTPFDETAVDFLEQFNVPVYKIASFEIVHLPLIKRVAETGKPMIMSCGMASLPEIAEAVACARSAGCEQLVLLKCTSAYPASAEASNIKTIPHMAEAFGCQVGLSDHTLGIGVAVAAVAYGATVIEKHFTLARDDGGVDSAFSAEPGELAALVRETANARSALGTVHYGLVSDESGSQIFRRSVFFSADVEAGQVLSRENIRCVRPGFGLPPRHFEALLGRKARVSVSKGTPVTWDLVV